MTTIKELVEKDLTPDTLNQLVEVLKQLSSFVNEELVRNAVSSDQSIVLIATAEEEKVVGTATMAFLYCTTGIRVHIEDVVVDSYYRGRGIARLLLGEAINRAQSLGARSIDLTSRPDKVTANRLYQNLGFVQRDTNVYRFVTPEHS